MDGNTGNPKVSKRMCRERSGRPKHERNQFTEFICEDKNLCPLKFRIYVRIFRRLGCFVGKTRLRRIYSKRSKNP